MSIHRRVTGIWSALLLGCVLNCFVLRAGAAAGASSEIRKQSNGYWLFIDGVRAPALAGSVYQATAGDLHIRAYTNVLHSLYGGMAPESAGGSSHGARLARLGIQAIRVYELPVESRDDAARTKEIFRRLYDNYGIKVLIGDWAGLNTGIDFRNPEHLAKVRAHIDQLVATYADEPWVLGWQLGNENNYHVIDGRLGHEIELSEEEYYKFMDGLAGQIKGLLGRKHLTQFVSLGQGDLTEAEAHLIGTTRNFDAIGINCYRPESGDFDALISLAENNFKLPIYFAEVGYPAEDHNEEQQQSTYLWHICSTIFSHSAGRMHSGIVLGVFIHEATDEAWKQFERGEKEDAHYGFLGKLAETDLRALLTRNHDFNAWVLPANDSPDALITAAWACLGGPYARKNGRDYGYAMAYANRAITLYQDEAKKQQAELVGFKSPPQVAANPKFWALNAVGTGYFIIGNAWMLMSYDYQGSQPAPDWWQHVLRLADVPPPAPLKTGERGFVAPTNAANCAFYARQVFDGLQAQYSYALLREANGTYRSFPKAIEARFPETMPPYIPFTWRNGAIFVASLFVVIMGMAALCGHRAKKNAVETTRILKAPARVFFILALLCNLTSLFWLVTWWISPVRMHYYTVRPVLFWTLTAIGGLGVVFYFYVWYLLWNMRRPVPMKAPPGKRVAVVTTRVASEPVEAFRVTLKKMSEISYPHDSYLLDEEDNPEAKAACAAAGVIHFSRKGKPQYNQPSGKFQTRTKGGNLNSWLYEFGKQYEFVTFLDPDHIPKPDFEDKVLGYFENPNVAFVQGPQVLNNQSASWIARGAAEQSYFFYGPLQMGLYGIGGCVVNGSHSTFRVSDLFTLKDDGYAVHDADDILTSMRIHAKKKHGVYVPEVLAEGLAPDTWEEFSKQQRRWAYSMFHLLFFFYVPGLFRMPWRCKLIYLVLTSFYFRGVIYFGLLVLPFVSAVTGNPPVNAHIAAFCLRFLPFFFFHYGALLFLGQCFLIPQGSRRGFWFRAGLLWVAMWWDHLCALMKAIRTPRVQDRVVAAKWKAAAYSPWRAVRPHIVLSLAALGMLIWTWLQADRRETVWGTLLFLGLIFLSQSIIILKVTRVPKPVPQAAEEPAEAAAEGRMAIPAALSQPR